MKKLTPSLALLAAIWLTSTPAHADRVDNLIRRLRGGGSSKVKVVAVIMLRKYVDPRVERALIKTLKDSAEDETVRSIAARALGGMYSTRAIGALRKVARSGGSRLKRAARKALEHLCPSRTSGKRFYINMDKIRSKGAMRRLAVTLTRRHLYRLLGRRTDVVTGWRRCRKPSRRALRKRRMKAYYLDTTVKVSRDGGKVKVKVSVLFTTYPGQSIKGNAGASAAVPGATSRAVVRQLVAALVGALKDDINRFLNTQ